MLQHDPDIPPNPPYFSASSTIWGSSIPVRGSFAPVYTGHGGGTASPGMMIPIGAMSLSSSRYETRRSGVLSLADEEEEEDVMVKKKELRRREVGRLEL
jgi:hypothetical protein